MNDWPYSQDRDGKERTTVGTPPLSKLMELEAQGSWETGISQTCVFRVGLAGAPRTAGLGSLKEEHQEALTTVPTDN